MAANSAVRATRLRALVVEERRALVNAKSRQALRRQEAEKLLERMRSDESALDMALEGFEVRLRRLDEWKDEPVVLVRSSAGGYALPVFHDAVNPCGHGQNLFGPRRMLLAEAEAAGHGACISCGWKARRRRIATAA